MIRILIFIVPLLMSTSNLLAQDPKLLYIFAESEKELVFQDNFDDDRNKWIEDENDSPDESDTIDVKIAGGVYYFHNNCKTRQEFCTDVSIDFRRNFEIEFKAKVNGERHDNLFGHVHWGRDSGFIFGERSGYMLDFNNYQKGTMSYAMSENKGKVQTVYVPSNFAKGGYNKYIIRKYEDKYYLYINGYRVGRYKYMTISGGKLCLGAGAGAIVEVDYIALKYLP